MRDCDNPGPSVEVLGCLTRLTNLEELVVHHWQRQDGYPARCRLRWSKNVGRIFVIQCILIYVTHCCYPLCYTLLLPLMLHTAVTPYVTHCCYPFHNLLAQAALPAAAGRQAAFTQ
jgi:hypothetical protein